MVKASVQPNIISLCNYRQRAEQWRDLERIYQNADTTARIDFILPVDLAIEVVEFIGRKNHGGANG